MDISFPLLRELRATVTCPICLDILSYPVTLPCHHSFCRACLRSCVSSTCPICKYAVENLVYLIDASCETGLETQFLMKIIQQVHLLTERAASDANVTRDSKKPLPNAALIALQNQQNRSDKSLKGEIFAVGAVVNVRPRMWPGINKPGGVAKIIVMKSLNERIFYDIQYVLDHSNERNVDECFISSASEVVSTLRSVRKRARREDHIASATDQTAPTRRVLHTGLDDAYLPTYHSFVEMFQLKAVDGFKEPSEDVDYVVMSSDTQFRGKKRTLKFMQGLLQGKIIVSHLWMGACLKKGVLLDWEKFEIRSLSRGDELDFAPSRAREAFRQVPSKFQ